MTEVRHFIHHIFIFPVNCRFMSFAHFPILPFVLLLVACVMGVWVGNWPPGYRKAGGRHVAQRSLGTDSVSPSRLNESADKT